MNDRFSGLSASHEELSLLFFEHQKALLERDMSNADHILSLYEKLIQHHTGLEEEWLLPVYEERIETKPGGDVANFVGEHSKILIYLRRLRDKLLKIKNSKDITAELIGLLDEEARFKDLVRHHDEREERFLFPELDKAIDGEERERLISKMRERR